MRSFLAVAAVFSLAACGSPEEEAQPEAVATEAIAPADTAATLPPPRREEFTAAWAEACPEAEPVSTALCKSKGLGDPGFTCDFGLGEDEYRRHTADLEATEEAWALVDPENTCIVE